LSFRIRLAAWFGLALVALILLLLATAHHHLDEELRLEKSDPSHPKYAEWSLHGSYTDEEVEDILGELIGVWIWVGVPALVLALGAGFLLANRSIRPVRLINRALAEKTPATLKSGIPLPEKDRELAELVSQINALMSRVGDAYDEMSAFSMRVAHELRTPLTLLRMRIERSAEDIPPELSEELQDELARLSRFVERSLLAAKAQAGRLDARHASIGLSEALADLRDPYDILAAQAGITIEWDVAPGLRVISDSDLLLQILHNLLGNACRYGATRVRIRARASGAGTVLVLTNDYRAQSRAVGGLGIGLRLVRALAAGMQGHRFSIRDNGRVFAVRLEWKPSNETSP
jgi:signal transduction histidine kinase